MTTLQLIQMTLRKLDRPTDNDTVALYRERLTGYLNEAIMDLTVELRPWRRDTVTVTRGKAELSTLPLACHKVLAARIDGKRRLFYYGSTRNTLLFPGMENGTAAGHMRHMMVVFYWQVEMAHINRGFACPYPKHSRSASLCFLCSLLRMHCVSLHPALRALNFMPHGTFVQLWGEKRDSCYAFLTSPQKGGNMSYEATGLMALFPVYLERAGHETDLEAVNSRIAQNENNLNQNLTILYDKLLELEAALAARE